MDVMFKNTIESVEEIFVKHQHSCEIMIHYLSVQLLFETLYFDFITVRLSAFKNGHLKVKPYLNFQE